MISCGEQNDLSEEVSYPSPIERILTQENHPGWGLSNCVLCHPVFQIHLTTTNPDIDLDEVRRAVEVGGLDSCMFCHGANGT